MENDERTFDTGGAGKFLACMVTLALLFAIGITIKREGDAIDREIRASEERMYIACLDKLVNPEHQNYAAQLTACKTGTQNVE